MHVLYCSELDDSLETGVVTPEPIVTVSEEVKVETVQSEGKNNEGKSEAKNDKEVEDSQVRVVVCTCKSSVQKYM